jgi:hypothetical protein
MSKLSEEEFHNEKDVAYYSALVTAWVESRMELDKSLVTLSAGGIGLLVTILSTVGVKESWELMLFSGAFISFLISIVACIIIFKRNSQIIEISLRDTNSQKPNVEKLDTIALSSFLCGILFSISIGIVAGIAQLNR